MLNYEFDEMLTKVKILKEAKEIIEEGTQARHVCVAIKWAMSQEFGISYFVAEDLPLCKEFEKVVDAALNGRYTVQEYLEADHPEMIEGLDEEAIQEKSKQVRLVLLDTMIAAYEGKI